MIDVEKVYYHCVAREAGRFLIFEENIEKSEKEDQHIKTYINAGDWATHQTYVIVDDGVARLQKFKR